jgi:hypothetical protein
MRWISLLLFVLSFGCHAMVAEGTAMREVASAPVRPDAGAATVVFVRPSFFGYGLVPTIVDESGAFVGQLSADSYFVASVPAGRHRFVAFWEEEGAVDAELVAGRVYVIELSIIFRVNMSGDGRPDLRPVRAGSSEYLARLTSLPKLHRYEPKTKEGESFVHAFHDEVARHLRDADSRITALSIDLRREHTVFAEDGR